MRNLSILQISIYGGALIAVIAVLRIFAINKLPKRTLIVLWGMAVLRLLLPFSLVSKFSIFNIINVIFSSKQLGKNVLGNTLQGRVGAYGNTAGSFDVSKGTFYMTLLQTFWKLGIVLLAIFFAVAFYKTYLQLRTALPIRDNLSINKWMSKHKLYRNLKVMVSDQITTPLAYGLLHPKIILPKCMNLDDEEQLNCVLTHELVHIKHFHIIWKFSMILVMCVHWFNPMVWLMYVLFNRDLEVSCDEEVMKIYGETKRSAYALYLIGMAEKQSKLNPLCNGFSKNSIKERIVLIMKYRDLKIKNILAACMAIGITTGVFATTALAEDKVTTAMAVTSVSKSGNSVVSKYNGTLPQAYTIKEYEQCVNDFKNRVALDIKSGQIKVSEIEKYNNAIKIMEDNLKKLKADNGKGNFILYKPTNIRTWTNPDGSTGASSVTTMTDNSKAKKSDKFGISINGHSIIGKFNTKEEADKAAQDYINEQVASGKMTQKEADNIKLSLK